MRFRECIALCGTTICALSCESRISLLLKACICWRACIVSLLLKSVLLKRPKFKGMAPRGSVFHYAFQIIQMVGVAVSAWHA